MASTNEIFSLLLVLSFMWYICHPQKKHRVTRESFIVGNSVSLGKTETAAQLYLYNKDLEYASKRVRVPVSFEENIRTRPLSPITKYR